MARYENVRQSHIPHCQQMAQSSQTIICNQAVDPQRSNHCHGQSHREAELDIAVVAYVKVISPKTLLITDNFLSQTANNIQENRKVCIACFDKNWNGIKIFGQAKYFNNGKWAKQVKSMSENNNLPAKGAILVTAQKVLEIG